MDLLGMINDGAEVLHRGSVDRSATASPAEPRKKAPPVWARVHRGRNNRIRDPKRWKLSVTRPELADGIESLTATSDDTDVRKEDSKSTLGSHIGAEKVSEIGPGGNISLSGLAASIAALVPSDDETKVIAGWIYEKVKEIDESLLDKIEVEFKLGLIADQNTPRHRFPTLSEAVVDYVYWRQERLRFKSEVSIQHFKSLETLLDSLMLANGASENNALTRVNLLTRDSGYDLKTDELPGDGPKQVRVSFSEQGSVLACISKERLGDLYISQPNSAYDLKLTLSIEHPLNFEKLAPQIKQTKPRHERNKNRLEWKSPGCQIDLTSVHAASASGATVTKEVEIETNSELLGATLKEIREGDKNGLDKFLEVIRYSIDSTRYILRNM